MNNNEMSTLMGTFLAFKSELDTLHSHLYYAQQMHSDDLRNEYLDKADLCLPKLKSIFKEVDQILMGHAISRTGK